VPVSPRTAYIAGYHDGYYQGHSVDYPRVSYGKHKTACVSRRPGERSSRKTGLSKKERLDAFLPRLRKFLDRSARFDDRLRTPLASLVRNIPRRVPHETVSYPDNSAATVLLVTCETVSPIATSLPRPSFEKRSLRRNRGDGATRTCVLPGNSASSSREASALDVSRKLVQLRRRFRARGCRSRDDSGCIIAIGLRSDGRHLNVQPLGRGRQCRYHPRRKLRPRDVTALTFRYFSLARARARSTADIFF